MGIDVAQESLDDCGAGVVVRVVDTATALPVHVKLVRRTVGPISNEEWVHEVLHSKVGSDLR